MISKIGKLCDNGTTVNEFVRLLAAELERLCDWGCEDLLASAKQTAEAEPIDVQSLLDDLIAELSNHAPPYCYFGMNPIGEYGFYPYSDFQQMIKDDGIPILSDLGALRRNYTGEALVISDHGNAEFYSVENGNAESIWSAV